MKRRKGKKTNDMIRCEKSGGKKLWMLQMKKKGKKERERERDGERVRDRVSGGGGVEAELTG